MSSARLECGCRRSKVSNVLLCVRRAETLCIDCNVEMYAGAATEVEALRKALGEAEEKAVQQQAVRKKRHSPRSQGPCQGNPAGAPRCSEKM